MIFSFSIFWYPRTKQLLPCYAMFIQKNFYPGEKENSKVRRLRDPSRRVFCSSGSDTFIMSTQNILGDISSLTVYHDNSGGGWFLR